MRIVRRCAIKRMARHTVAVMVEVMRVLFGTALGLEKFLRFPPCRQSRHSRGPRIHRCFRQRMQNRNLAACGSFAGSAIEGLAGYAVAVVVEAMGILAGASCRQVEILSLPP